MKTFYNTINRQAEGEAGAAPVEAPATPPVEAPVEAPVAEAPAEAPVTLETENKPPQGLLDRIGQLTRQKRELEERLASMEAPQQQYYEAQQAPAGNVDPRQVQMEIYRQAQELAKQNEWKTTTDKIWNEGLAKYGDWAPQLNNMACLLYTSPSPRD